MKNAFFRIKKTKTVLLTAEFLINFATLIFRLCLNYALKIVKIVFCSFSDSNSEKNRPQSHENLHIFQLSEASEIKWMDKEDGGRFFPREIEGKNDIKNKKLNYA